jgi:sensor histidine kinase regulating citrate/malate metabolism
MQQSKDSEINISKEILNVLSNFEARAQELKIIIRKNLPNKLLFFGDKRALTHIVSNLISNAIESFNDKSVSKVISVELKKFKNVILFSVTDSGSGINHENLDKIFKSGFTTKPKGHGIGLYAIKELVEKKFYGSINFKSSSGGTSFLIKIPMRNQTQ